MSYVQTARNWWSRHCGAEATVFALVGVAALVVLLAGGGA
jgi:hypothetical protein